MRRNARGESPRILVIRFSSLGDVVLASAALEALAAASPGVQVDVLTKPAFFEVFEGHHAVSDVVQWRPDEGLGALAGTLRSRNYDWVVDLHANLRTRLLRLMVPRPHWSVYGKELLRRRVAVWVRRPDWLDGRRHVVDRYVEALAPLGVSGERRRPTMAVDDGLRERVLGQLREGGWNGRTPLLGLAPGARWATKAWPPDRWEQLLRLVSAKALSQPLLPVLIGGADEEELCVSILGRAGSAGISLSGRTSIRETAAALSLCSVLVTNDSAPLHVATAVGTPVVALFGPTHRGFGFFPLGDRDVLLERTEGCRPCSLHGDDACPEGHHRCLTTISPEEVFSAVQRVLDAEGGVA